MDEETKNRQFIPVSENICQSKCIASEHSCNAEVEVANKSAHEYTYEIKNETAIITGFQGAATRIQLPAQIEGCPVAAVARKAFLSQKSLYAVSFPDTIEEIGDWAFAHCDNLTELSFPRQTVRFGKSVFKNCGNLKRIEIRNPHRAGQPDSDTILMDAPERPMDSQTSPPRHLSSPSLRHLPPSLPRLQASPSSEHPPIFVSAQASAELLAATVTMLDAYYLLDIQTAGSSEWLEKWDTKLLSILRTHDQEGYISQSVYGEEDYIGTDLEEYTSERRKEKSRLAYLRLLHPQALPPALKQELEAYLRSHTKGQPNEEAWQVLKEEHAGHREYYKLFAELSCITAENYDAILADIGEDSPEMKAFFLKSMENQREEKADFFESLEL